jgi:hypothetical protein
VPFIKESFLAASVRSPAIQQSSGFPPKLFCEHVMREREAQAIARTTTKKSDVAILAQNIMGFLDRVMSVPPRRRIFPLRNPFNAAVRRTANSASKIASWRMRKSGRPPPRNPNQGRTSHHGNRAAIGPLDMAIHHGIGRPDERTGTLSNPVKPEQHKECTDDKQNDFHDHAPSLARSR